MPSILWALWNFAKFGLQLCNPPSLSGGSRHCSAAADTGTCYYQSLPSWSLWFLACSSSCLCSAEHLVAYRGIWAGSSRGHGHRVPRGGESPSSEACCRPSILHYGTSSVCHSSDEGDYMAFLFIYIYLINNRMLQILQRYHAGSRVDDKLKILPFFLDVTFKFS